MPEEKDDEQIKLPKWVNTVVYIAGTMALGAAYALHELEKDNISTTNPVYYQTMKLTLITIRSFGIVAGARLLAATLKVAKEVISKTK